MAEGVLQQPKHARAFESALSFIYQAYQLSVNNFSGNRLFEQFATADLANLLGLNILVFNSNDLESPAATIITDVHLFEPDVPACSIALEHDFVYLEASPNSQYTWLMPNSSKLLVSSRLFDAASTTTKRAHSSYFSNDAELYTTPTILLSSRELFRCFGSTLLTEHAHLAFVEFMSECPVQMLVTLSEPQFAKHERLETAVDYMNAMWGKNHFRAKDISLIGDLFRRGSGGKRRREKTQRRLGSSTELAEASTCSCSCRCCGCDCQNERRDITKTSNSSRSSSSRYKSAKVRAVDKKLLGEGSLLGRCERVTRHDEEEFDAARACKREQSMALDLTKKRSDK